MTSSTPRLRVAAAIAVLGWCATADAFPAFAKKYGMSCTACHIAWPIFNQEGQNFRDNGYQFGLGKDDPVTLSQAYAPIALRTTPAYQFTRMTNQPSADRGLVTTTSGGIAQPAVDILTGGTIAKDVSFLLVIAGFSADEAGAVESAFARFDNLGGSGWANFKIGKFEIDQPASAHRNPTLTYGYAAYAAHPVGSVVAFAMDENQLGVELDGHDARSTTRYALSFTSASGAEGLSSNAWSAPFLYGHVQRAFDLPTSVLSWVRVGALGGVGWWPTDLAHDADGNPIPGTGKAHDKFYRAGAEVSWILGRPATPMFFTAAYIYGREEKGLAQGTDPGGADLSQATGEFNSAFLELDWVPTVVQSYAATPWLLFARWDGVRYRHGPGDVNGGTVGVRRYLALGPRASAAIHLEYHYDKVKGGAWLLDDTADPGLSVATQTALAGVDFDF